MPGAVSAELGQCAIAFRHRQDRPVALARPRGALLSNAMARLSDLTSTLAAASGVPMTAASVIARSLREAGLVSKRGRGLSAARMGNADVASLLLAFSSPVDVTKAGPTVKALGELRLEPGASRDRTGGQTLRSVLEALVECYSPEGALILGRSSQNPVSPPRAISLSVTKDRHGWKAIVTVEDGGGDVMALNFSRDEVSSPRGSSDDHPGRRETMMLGPAIVDAAIRCVRNDAVSSLAVT